MPDRTALPAASRDSARPAAPAAASAASAARRVPAPVAAPLAAAGLAATALFVLLYWLSNRTVAGQQLENSWARRYDVDVTVGHLLDFGRVPPFNYDHAVIVMGILLSLALAALARRWRAGIVVLVAGPASIAVGQLFKDTAGRPPLVHSLDVAPSYPSGHAGICLTLTAALLLAVPPIWARRIAPPLVLWTLVVAAALQGEGQHRASDVLGSGLIVAAVFLLVAGLVALAPGGAVSARPTPRARTQRHPAALAGTVLLAVAAAVVGGWCPIPWMTAVYAASALVATAAVLGATTLVARAVLPLGATAPSPA